MYKDIAIRYILNKSSTIAQGEDGTHTRIRLERIDIQETNSPLYSRRLSCYSRRAYLFSYSTVRK